MKKHSLNFVLFVCSAHISLFCYAAEHCSGTPVMSQSSEHYRPKRPKLSLKPRNLASELNSEGEKKIWQAKPKPASSSQKQPTGCNPPSVNPLLVMMQYIEKNHPESGAAPAMSKKPLRLHIPAERDIPPKIILISTPFQECPAPSFQEASVNNEREGANQAITTLPAKKQTFPLTVTKSSYYSYEYRLTKNNLKVQQQSNYPRDASRDLVRYEDWN